ncbi:MAG: DUF1580 domain-containing protein [Sedimentisphaerales bacterium]
MAISKDEQLITLVEATKMLPRVGGKRMNVSTLWRWCKKGLQGCNLEYVRVGAKIATSSDALNRFFVLLANADKVKQLSSDVHLPRKHRHPTDISRQRAIEEANNILVRAGIKKPTKENIACAT